MEQRLTIAEQENLILKNQNLVRYLVNRYFKVSKNEFEDFVSIGKVGLIKAAKTYDNSKKTNFSAYASTCIINEIRMYLRKQKTERNKISLDDPIGTDSDGNELTLRDTIPCSNRDFTEEIVDNDILIRLISIILNLLNPRDRLIMLYKISGNTQRVIAEYLNISRSYVSRLEQEILKELKFILNTPQQFKEVFSMKITGDSYNLSFSSKDVKNFNKIFANFSQNLKSVDDLPTFKIVRNKDRIAILLPADLESFHFIGKLMQEFDDYTMTFVPDKTTFPSNNTELPKSISDNTNESNCPTEKFKSNIMAKGAATTEFVSSESGNNSDLQDTTEETDDTSDSQDVTKETNDTSDTKKVSQSKQVKDYILTKKSFTTKELKQHFPDLTTNLATYLTLLKKDGLIASTGRGEYVVVGNKT